jgi:hypothetical protein
MQAAPIKQNARITSHDTFLTSRAERYLPSATDKK